MYADQAKTGFLSRPEFYNVLKLVTVAQSKRELTQDIVKAALYAPAAAKIPAPRINSPASHVPLPNLTAAASTPQMRTIAPPGSQQFGFGPQGVQNAVVNQQYHALQPNQNLMPPQVMSSGVASGIPQVGLPEPRGGNFIRPNVPNSNISNNWLGGRTSGASTGSRGITPSMHSQVPGAASGSQAPILTSSQVTSNNSKALASGNGFASGSFGGDIFSATPSPAKLEASVPNYAVSRGVASAAGPPVFGGSQPLDSSTTTMPKQPSSGQFQSIQVSLNTSPNVSAPGTLPLGSAGITTEGGNSTINNWPKMKPSDVQKYTKVFMEVDIDRDGKITGEQARNLFLSWRLPRGKLDNMS